MRAFSKVQTDDRNINQLQQNLEAAIGPILRNELVNGYVIKEVSLGIGPTTVNHGLNRELLGWFLTRQSAAATVYDNQDDNPNPTQTLILVSDAVTTVNVYVF